MPVVFKARSSDGSTGRDSDTQAAIQFAYIIITLAIALSSGAAVGLVLRSKEFDPPTNTDQLFVDSVCVVWCCVVLFGLAHTSHLTSHSTHSQHI